MEGASSSRQDHGDSGKLQLIAFEKCTAESRNVRNLDHLDTGLADLSFQPFKAAERRHEYLAETETGSLDDAPVRLRDRTDFSAEAYLSGKADIRRYRKIKIGRKHCAYHGKVTGWIAHLEASRHIQEHILHAQLETGTLLQNSEKHVQTTHIEACGASLRRAVRG